MSNRRWLLLVALAMTACSGDGRGFDRAGAGPQPFVSDLFVVGHVVIDPATYHFTDPSLLIASSEGAGPRTLEVNVATSVSPHVSYTGTRTPSRSEISTALGYDVGVSIVVAASTSVLVPVNAYARVAAYPTFQKSTWQLVGPGGFPVGTGVTYKPIGVYFDTCGCIGPDPCGVGCVANYPYGLSADQGTGGTGTTTNGTGGAGGSAGSKTGDAGP